MHNDERHEVAGSGTADRLPDEKSEQHLLVRLDRRWALRILTSLEMQAQSHTAEPPEFTHLREAIKAEMGR